MSGRTDRNDELSAQEVGASISRRHLLMTGGVMGAWVLGGGALLEACSSSGSSPAGSGPTTGSSSGGAASPAAGGSVTGAFLNTIDNFDPTTASDASLVVMSDYIFEGLYRLNPLDRTEVLPQLATALPQKVGPTTYRFSIRPNVVFHDGSPLTADDVVFTINRVLDPKTNSLDVAFFTFMTPTSARAVSATEVELKLTAPCTLLAKRLAIIRVMSKKAVMAAKNQTELQTKPVGSGPYKVTSFVSNEQVTLSKFAGYNGDLDATYDTITLRVMTNDNARLAALETGQVSAVEQLPFALYSSVAKSNSVRSQSVQGFGQVDLLFHCGKPPFDDYRARQAICFCLNRDLITKDVFFGQATAAWDNCLLPSNEGYITPDLVYSYDPDRAKSLLKAAGVTPGTKVDLLIPTDYSYIQTQAPIIKQNMAAIGLEANLIEGETTGLYSKVTAGNFNLFFSPGDTSQLGVYDSEALLRWDYYGTTASQFYFWTDASAKRTNHLLNAAITAPTVAGRNRLLAEVQNIVQEQAPAPTIHFLKEITAWSPKLEGFHATAGSGLDFLGVTGSA